jgi:hypothetical protein
VQQTNLFAVEQGSLEDIAHTKEWVNTASGLLQAVSKEHQHNC